MEEPARKETIYVYLDDIRRCPPGFVLARNAEECIALLQEYDVALLSLDFDLGWGQASGLTVANYIAAHKSEIAFPEEIYLHSSSAIGRLSMFQALYPHKPPHAVLVNGPMPDAVLLRAAQAK